MSHSNENVRAYNNLSGAQKTRTRVLKNPSTYFIHVANVKRTKRTVYYTEFLISARTYIEVGEYFDGHSFLRNAIIQFSEGKSWGIFRATLRVSKQTILDKVEEILTLV